MTPSGIEPATFRLVTQCLNHYATACPISKDRTAFSFRVNQYKKTELDWLTLEDGIYRFSRNVSTKPPSYAALNPQRAQISYNTVPFMSAPDRSYVRLTGHFRKGSRATGRTPLILSIHSSLQFYAPMMWTYQQILFRETSQVRWDRRGMWHAGPYLRKGPRASGPGRQIFRGGILKKSRLKYGMREKKAVHEREI